MTRGVSLQARLFLVMAIACASITFVAAHAAQSQDNSGKALPLLDTQWSLISLNGEAIPQTGLHAHFAFKESKPLTEQLASGSTGNLANASDGCNQITGMYETDGYSLHIDVGLSTLLACRVEVEYGPPSISFGDALRLTSRFEIHGSTVLLMDQSGKVLARLAGAEPK
jgi:heat shock protein HslJ